MPDQTRSISKSFYRTLCARLFLLCFVFCMASGCYSSHEYSWPPVELSGPGWMAYNGQAIWRPTTRVPELTGDVFVSLSTNAEAFIQFSKTLPFLSAQIDSWHWQVNIPSQKRIYSGRVPPPAHFAWLQLPALLRRESPPSPWQFSGNANNWQIKNPETGETLSGFLNMP